MKLYNLNSSPYCSRVRYYVYASALPVDIVTQDFKDPAYKQVNPLGKIPSLQLDDGTYARCAMRRASGAPGAAPTPCAVRRAPCLLLPPPPPRGPQRAV